MSNQAISTQTAPAAMNEVYSTFFTAPYPARAAFQVLSLPKGARVEIEAVAVQ